MKRTAITNKIAINSISFSSIFNIGDTAFFKAKSKEISQQKKDAIFKGDEDVFFQDYSIFSRKANWPYSKGKKHIHIVQENNAIKVNKANLFDISGSSVFQIGSINQVVSESRVKIFRP